MPAIDTEARTFGLLNVERLDVGARRLVVSSGVIAFLLRDRNHHLVVDEVDNPVVHQIDHRDDTFDRMRVAVISEFLAKIAHRTYDARAAFELPVKEA